MNIGAAFPSNYLKAEDFPANPSNPQGDTTYIMSHVELEKLKAEDGSEDEKPVLYFSGHDKGIVLNKTNATAISQQYGQETTTWAGKPITMYATEVQYGKQTMMGIRVRLRANPALMAPNQTATPPAGQTAPASSQGTPANPPKDPALEAAKAKAYKQFITDKKTANPAATEQQVANEWIAALVAYFGSRDAARAADAAAFDRFLNDKFFPGGERQSPDNIDPGSIPF